jgi:hypothetical protein
MTTIRSVRVFSAAKVNALLYGILGLLMAPFFLLGPGLAMLGESGRPTGFGGAIVFAAFLPFCYAVFGFIAGALIAFIYNAISHAVGGLEIELQTHPAVVSSPPVQAPPSPIMPEVPPPASPEFG